MIVQSKSVKRRVVVRRKNKKEKQYTPPKLPSTPKVTIGPKSYGRSKKGKYIVVRFWVTQRKIEGKFRRVKEPLINGISWFVMDFEGKGVAKGTKLEGYIDKKEAIKVARQYRDKYGVWSRSPF